MDLIAVIEGHLRNAAAALVADGVLEAIPGRIEVEPAREEAHGDLTCAVALGAGRHAGLESRILAERIAGKLGNNPDFSAVEVAGPGFLNMTIAPEAWARMLVSLLAAGVDYGRRPQDGGATINIGFLPVDGTRPLPANFARCTIVGDALVNLLDFTGRKADRHYRVNGKGAITLKLAQPVSLLCKGGPGRTDVSLAELIAEIGNDAARFGLLMHRNGTAADLDLDLLQDMSSANPLFLVQYAHARCCAIRNQARRRLSEPPMPSAWDSAAFGDAGARLILRYLCLYPLEIDLAARSHEPSRLAHYLHALARELHAQYYRSLTAPHLRFIRDDDRLLTGARLALVRGVETVLKSGLALLGVCAPDEIR